MSTHTSSEGNSGCWRILGGEWCMCGRWSTKQVLHLHSKTASTFCFWLEYWEFGSIQCKGITSDALHVMDSLVYILMLIPGILWEAPLCTLDLQRMLFFYLGKKNWNFQASGFQQQLLGWMIVRNALFGVCIPYIIKRQSYLKYRQPRQSCIKDVKQLLKANISMITIKYSLLPLSIDCKWGVLGISRSIFPLQLRLFAQGGHD